MADMLIFSGVPGPPYFSGFLSEYIPSARILDKDEYNRIIDGIAIFFAGIYDAEGVLLGETEKGKGLVSKVFKEIGIPFENEILL